MRTLYNWKAKRAGAKITVTAFEQVNGKFQAVKVVGVDKIGTTGRPQCPVVAYIGFDQINLTVAQVTI